MVKMKLAWVVGKTEDDVLKLLSIYASAILTLLHCTESEVQVHAYPLH
jgi:hypothetical protein